MSFSYIIFKILEKIIKVIHGKNKTTEDGVFSELKYLILKSINLAQGLSISEKLNDCAAFKIIEPRFQIPPVYIFQLSNLALFLMVV